MIGTHDVGGGTRRMLRAAALAGLFGGVPSTCYALATGGDLLESTRAAGTILLPDDAAPRRLVTAGVVVHALISLAWSAVFAAVLPRRRAAIAGAAAGFGVAAIDLGIARRRFPRIAALPRLAQVADHVAFGALVGHQLARSRDTSAAR